MHRFLCDAVEHVSAIFKDGRLIQSAGVLQQLNAQRRPQLFADFVELCEIPKDTVRLTLA